MQYSPAFFFIFMVFVTSALHAQTKPVIITIAADSWCPINCTKPEKKLGVGIDLAKSIFEPLGYTIQYEVMGWSDALAKVRRGEVDAVVGASKFDASQHTIFVAYLGVLCYC